MSHFGSHRRTGMLACAGPSRPHTCVSGSPGRGGWGGQRSPLWATATGPGLFRSLGFKNPSGYWLFGGQHTAIQRVGRLGGAEAHQGGGGGDLPEISAGPMPAGRWERVPSPRISTTRNVIRALTRRATSDLGAGRIGLSPVIKSTYPLNRGYLCG